jgi:hypothetical protein
MVVDNDGNIVVDTQKIDYPMRIHNRDVSVVKGEHVLIVCGEEGGKMSTYTI